MNRKALFSSVMTIALCLCLIAGSTFALFTAEEQVDIAVTAGGVELRAFIRNDSVRTFWCGNPTQKAGVFRNGGTAKISGENLILRNMLPGDKAEVTVDVLNDSNISIMYRVVMQVEGKLGEVLTATANGQDLTTSLSKDQLKSEWIHVAAPGGSENAEIAPLTLTVELPTWVENEYVNAPGSVSITVQAMQYVGEGTGTVFLNDRAYSSVEAALESAADGENAVLEIAGSVEWDPSKGFPTKAASVTVKGLALAELTLVGAGVGASSLTSLPIAFEDLTLIDASAGYTEAEWSAAYLAIRSHAAMKNVTVVRGDMTEVISQ